MSRGFESHTLRHFGVEIHVSAPFLFAFSRHFLCFCGYFAPLFNQAVILRFFAFHKLPFYCEKCISEGIRGKVYEANHFLQDFLHYHPSSHHITRAQTDFLSQRIFLYTFLSSVLPQSTPAVSLFPSDQRYEYRDVRYLRQPGTKRKKDRRYASEYT